MDKQLTVNNKDITDMSAKITELVGVRTFKYEDRLKYLDLPTLKFRQMRGDMRRGL